MFSSVLASTSTNQTTTAPSSDLIFLRKCNNLRVKFIRVSSPSTTRQISLLVTLVCMAATEIFGCFCAIGTIMNWGPITFHLVDDTVFVQRESQKNFVSFFDDLRIVFQIVMILFLALFVYGLFVENQKLISYCLITTAVYLFLSPSLLFEFWLQNIFNLFLLLTYGLISFRLKYSYYKELEIKARENVRNRGQVEKHALKIEGTQRVVTIIKILIWFLSSVELIYCIWVSLTQRCLGLEWFIKSEVDQNCRKSSLFFHIFQAQIHISMAVASVYGLCSTRNCQLFKHYLTVFIIYFCITPIVTWEYWSQLYVYFILIGFGLISLAVKIIFYLILKGESYKNSGNGVENASEVPEVDRNQVESHVEVV